VASPRYYNHVRFVLIVMLASCAGVRVVERTSTGGTLELDGDRTKAMDEADREMAAHCGQDNASITYAESTRGAYVVHYRCNGT
jgi:hypothetical protein